jgi:hypothetical protein
VRAARAQGRVEILRTHLLLDELAAGPQPEADTLLAWVRDVTTAIPTAGFVLGLSRYDEAAYTTDDQAAVYREFAGSNPKHAEDTLTLLTAQRECAAVVTNDHTLARRCRRKHVAVMTAAAFLELLAD